MRRSAEPPLHPPASLTSEVLILPDGRVLAHDLTATFADLLSELNPQEEGIRRRRQAVQQKTP